MKTTCLFLLFTVALKTGLIAGLGFANAIGYIPAMEDTPANHLLSFWPPHIKARRISKKVIDVGMTAGIEQTLDRISFGLKLNITMVPVHALRHIKRAQRDF